MRLIVQPDNKKSYIHPEIYGNFSEHLGRCIYNGVFVGEDSPIENVNGMRTDVVEALKKIKLPVLRWPGGCFADEYHWTDGIGEKENRKKMINTHWGGVVEDNSFGTHEFFELCRQVGCEPYVNGNVGSGSVQEMAEWIEYMTSGDISPMANLRRKNGKDEPWKLKYFAVGNENWGCGGNMRSEYYADLYRRYATYIRNFSGNNVYKIACGPGCSVGGPNYEWTETLMKNAAHLMHGLSLHYYTLPTNKWDDKGSATEFTKEEYYNTLANANYIEELCEKHGAIMDRYDPEKKIGLIVDEWGAWYNVEPGTNPGFLYQQSTMRDAMIAALTLNIFNRHSDRVHMANIAQLINVLQAVILTDGAKMLLTPTFHVFDLFSRHQGATLVESILPSDRITAENKFSFESVSHSASVSEDGKLHITLANLSADCEKEFTMRIDGSEYKLDCARILTGEMNAFNDFDAPETVKIVPFEEITVSYDRNGTECAFVLPKVSVLSLTFSK